MIKAFWRLHPKPNPVSELVVAQEQFAMGPINKAVSNFRKSFREYMKADGGHFELLL